MNFSSKDDRDRLYDYHKHNLVYIGDYIKFADAKAGVALSVTLLMLGFFGKIAKENGFSGLNFWEYSLLIGLIPLLVACFIFILRILWPNYPTGTTAYMSWGGIGSFENSREYLNRLNSLSDKQLINDMAKQNYSLADVCLTKYKNLKLGFKFLTAGAIIETVSWFFS
ncbi:Pycsar system effector family protein [Cytobacillus firmus]|uniref:Pycsar system effector family protein n=1 Tax=Bacillus sp. 22-7 TaxID=2709707 RepID=UPI0013D59BAD|nr:Pycsar system effector family protein [Bacillus sp. 22-7]